MKKIVYVVVGGIILCVGLGLYFFRDTLVSKKEEGVTDREKKLNVVTTFYPLEYLSKEIGKDNVSVRVLTPPGGEPHDFEPTAKDIIMVRTADVFVMNGADFEPWAEKLLNDLSKDSVRIVEMSEKMDLLAGSNDEHDEEKQNDEEAGGHHHEIGEFDPHFWLSPVRLIEETLVLRDAFVQIDPKNAQKYTENAAILMARLSGVEKQYREKLSQCDQKEIVTSHNAFAYVAKDYNFFVHGIAGLSPTQEPSAQHLAELTKLVKEENIQYIFTETLVSPKFAETLAKETGVRVGVLNPVEGLTEQEKKEGKNLETVLLENLKSFQLGLNCRG
jgi:zinc transport system substrate-binding protein